MEVRRRRRVRFECECGWTKPGQWVGVVGSTPALGEWQLPRCVRLSTDSARFPLWQSPELLLPEECSGAKSVEFKFIVAQDSHSQLPQQPQQTQQLPVSVVWEPLPGNRTLPAAPLNLLCRCVFGQPSSGAVQSLQEVTPPFTDASSLETPVAPSRRDQQAAPLELLQSSSAGAERHDDSGDDFSPSSNAAVSCSSSPSEFHSLADEARRPRSLEETSAEDAGAAAPSFARLKQLPQTLQPQQSLPSAALEFLVAGNCRASSWREKLLLVRDLLQRELEAQTEHSSPPAAPRDLRGRLARAVDALAFACVYLDLVNQGLVKCAEDGGHFRPNHHARLSQEVNLAALRLVQRQLQTRPRERTAGGGALWMRDDLTRLLVAAQGLALALPSFAAAFQVAAPLTRIRNIAHRDDIPRELKQRIKTTLQNKIHRCAGPEDLVAAEQLLRQLLDEGRSCYSEDFLSEFVLFVSELNAFFKQDDLEERLGVLRQLEGSRVQEAIDRFLDAKQRSDSCACSGAEGQAAGGNGVGSLECICGGIQPVRMLLTMRLATELRRTFCLQVEEGLAQRGSDELNLLNKRIAELQLEGSVFVYTSRVANYAQGDSQRQLRLTEALEALYIGVTNLEISGIWREECRALQRELQFHCRTDLSSNVAQQFLFSTVKRVNDLCVEVSDLLLALYAHRAHLLGDSLSPSSVLRKTSHLDKCSRNAQMQSGGSELDGLAADLRAFQCNVYAEGKVRSSLLFQLSRLTQFLLKQLRERLALPQLDVLVPGEALGRVAVFHSLDEASAHLRKLRAESASGGDAAVSRQLPLILCAEKASGDEEVCGLGTQDGLGAAAVVVAHDLPVLSHLGVRARQEGIPFVACANPAAFAQFLSLRGSCAALSATIERTTVRRVGDEEAERRRASFQKKGTSLPSSAWRPPHSLQTAPVERYPTHKAEPPPLLRAREMALETCGSKAFACARIELLSEDLATRSAAQSGEEAEEERASAPVFSCPRSGCLPFGSMEWTLAAAGRQRDFDHLLDALEKTAPEDASLPRLCAKMQKLLQQLPLPETIQSQVVSAFGPKARLAVRSSASAEDLKGHSAAGLYDSVINVGANDPVYLQSAVGTVWASLFSLRAVLSRKAAKLRQGDACMAVLIQNLVLPALSFVLHTGGLLPQSAACRGGTKDDARGSESLGAGAGLLLLERSGGSGQAVEEVYAEIAPGLGELLASAKTRGSGYRLLINKKTGAFKMLSACTFASVTVPVIPRSRSFSTLRDATPLPRRRRLLQVVYDQTADPFAQDAAFREKAASGIAALSVALEETFGCAQDVEGVISARGGLFVVQSRAQP